MKSLTLYIITNTFPKYDQALSLVKRSPELYRDGAMVYIIEKATGFMVCRTLTKKDETEESYTNTHDTARARCMTLTQYIEKVCPSAAITLSGEQIRSAVLVCPDNTPILPIIKGTTKVGDSLYDSLRERYVSVVGFGEHKSNKTIIVSCKAGTKDELEYFYDGCRCVKGCKRRDLWNSLEEYISFLRGTVSR